MAASGWAWRRRRAADQGQSPRRLPQPAGPGPSPTAAHQHSSPAARAAGLRGCWQWRRTSGPDRRRVGWLRERWLFAAECPRLPGPGDQYCPADCGTDSDQACWGALAGLRWGCSSGSDRVPGCRWSNHPSGRWAACAATCIAGGSMSAAGRQPLPAHQPADLPTRVVEQALALAVRLAAQLGPRLSSANCRR